MIEFRIGQKAQITEKAARYLTPPHPEDRTGEIIGSYGGYAWRFLTNRGSCIMTVFSHELEPIKKAKVA